MGQNNSEGESWIKDAASSLDQEDRRNAEEEVEGAASRVKEASDSLSKGEMKEASSTLSSGRHKDKAGGTKDKVKGWVKETTSSLTGNQEKRAEGRADQLKGVAKDKKGHVKDLFKFP